MNRTELLKKLLPGFIPLFVFIAADEIWGTEIGMYIAVGVGIIQLIYTFIKEKRFDKFILVDTLLIVGLGVVSILLDNPKFILIKPVLIEVVLIILLGISGFTPYNFMLSMSKRYMKGVEVNDAQIKQMTSSVRIMFFVFLVHTGLSLYSVFYMSSSASVFITGGLFYILFGAYFLIEIVRMRIKRKNITSELVQEEILPIVDEKGKVIGKAPRSLVHSGKKLLHPVVHLHIINNAKQLYLQKRRADRLIQPGKWDAAVGGHISVDETIEQGLIREAKEEIGIADFDAKLLVQYKWESDVEKELVFMFIAKYNGDITPNPDEIEEGRFWSVNEINKSLNKDVFTPNFKMEFDLIRKKVLK